MQSLSLEQLQLAQGTVQALSDAERNRGVLFCVRWKGGLTLQLSNRWSSYWVTIEKDDTIFKSIRLDKEKYVMNTLQNQIRDIERGAYARKKSTAQRVVETVQQRQLTSCMNNTKWSLFRTAMMEEMPFPPPYEIKTLFDEADPWIDSFIAKHAGYPGCYIDEDFVNLNYKVIEYLVVKTQYYETTGGLLVQQQICHDATKQFLELMNKYHIPYTPYRQTDDTFFIYGYI